MWGVSPEGAPKDVISFGSLGLTSVANYDDKFVLQRVRQNWLYAKYP